MRVPQQQRTPGADQVDVAAPVGVGDPGAGPSTMNRGVPPTAWKARTGLFTPPGMICRPRAKRPAETGAS
ncbi:hypothetical protein [Blastococcus brunescens]|uniref:Uncharacterized protein n=1 Tax=Blastococcus brunescens TaxID=1564165 RepID=A0ABZ1BB62_9ACTN|nr:hypothetical protein [Blastococcus sp. BMG 8361]WRL67308.1 hypothetical protein U6N30_25760 [Blastococcus sp. BMG 8361]